jgi:predicted GIY-YIG superfamily endonuclease
MNRGALIARLSRHVHPPVLDALPTDWMRQAVAALDAPRTPLERNLAVGIAFQLPGESEPHSVYRLTFADGSAYAGMTGRDVLNRIEEHFGAGERGSGIGNLGIRERAALGSWRIEVLASGLSRDDAMALERQETARLPAALNVQNATTRARDLHDPAQSAVARYYLERGQ